MRPVDHVALMPISRGASQQQVISTSEVGRIVRFEDLRPHRVRQWLKSEDPVLSDNYISPTHCLARNPTGRGHCLT